MLNYDGNGPAADGGAAMARRAAARAAAAARPPAGAPGAPPDAGAGGFSAVAPGAMVNMRGAQPPQPPQGAEGVMTLGGGMVDMRAAPPPDGFSQVGPGGMVNMRAGGAAPLGMGGMLGRVVRQARAAGAGGADGFSMAPGAGALVNTMAMPPGTGPHPTPMPTAGTVPPAVPYADTSDFGPGRDLRSTQISPTAGADRFSIAGQRFDQFARETEPAYGAAVRAATKAAAANGRLKSGMLTTEFGDLADRRAQSMDLARSSFMTDALEGSIGDQLREREELRGERGYQQGLSQQAFQNRLAALGATNSLNMGQLDLMSRLAFSGNPAGVMLGAADGMGGADNGAGNLLAMWAQRRAGMSGGQVPSTLASPSKQEVRGGKTGGIIRPAPSRYMQVPQMDWMHTSPPPR
jgi:hypothetical protein